MAWSLTQDIALKLDLASNTLIWLKEQMTKSHIIKGLLARVAEKQNEKVNMANTVTHTHTKKKESVQLSKLM